MTTSAMTALRRLRQPPATAAAASRCEFCAQPLAEQHEHVVALASGELSCACIACALLFEHPDQPLRRLPRDARYLAGFDLEPQEWASLQIPVKLAFITVSAENGAVQARYPSPGGVVTAPLERSLWDELRARHTGLRALQPGLEALLLNYLERPHQLFLVPLDRCYRLVGLVRTAWTGFSGGPEVRRQVRDFCAELRGGTSHA
ncbi:MAG: DUF5947 family protein [Terriglobales bacterium]